MTTKKSYKKEDLDKYVEGNEIELIGGYEKVNSKTIIKGKCKTDGCDEVFMKTLWSLFNKKYNLYCNHCIRNINGKIKIKKASDKFIEEANILHDNKYDYSKFTYINAKTKSIIICPEHGEFLKDPHHHLRKISKYSGCLLCNKEVSNNERIIKYNIEFIKKANKLHNNKYDYSKFNYTNAKTKSIIICPIHGEFLQCSDGHLTGRGCKKCSIISISDFHRKSNDEFIKEANIIHKNKYD